jgi:hypothetical protein
VWADEDWTLYAVRDAVPLATPAGRLSASLHAEGGRSQKLARLVAMDVDSFELEARRPGGYVVRVRYNRFWRVAAGRACIAKAGEWTRVEVRRPGRVRVEAPPSLRGLFGTEKRC